jgi:hypothetical protein
MPRLSEMSRTATRRCAARRVVLWHERPRQEGDACVGEREQKASASILRGSRRLPCRQAIPAGRLSAARSCSSSGAAFARRELAAGSSLPRWQRKRESGRATCRPSRRSASSSSRARSTPRVSFAPTPTTSASTASFSSTSTTLASAPTRLLRHLPSSSYELGLCGRTALPPQSSSSRLPARCLRGSWAGRRRGRPARAQPRRQRQELLPRPARARRDRPHAAPAERRDRPPQPSCFAPTEGLAGSRCASGASKEDTSSRARSSRATRIALRTGRSGSASARPGTSRRALPDAGSRSRRGS